MSLQCKEAVMPDSMLQFNIHGWIAGSSAENGWPLASLKKLIWQVNRQGGRCPPLLYVCIWIRIYIVDTKPCPCPWTLSFSCVACGQETQKRSTTKYKKWHHLLHHQVNWCPGTLTYMIRLPCPSSFNCSWRQSNPEPANPYIRTQVCSSYNITSRKKTCVCFPGADRRWSTNVFGTDEVPANQMVQLLIFSSPDLSFHLEWRIIA